MYGRKKAVNCPKVFEILLQRIIHTFCKNEYSSNTTVPGNIFDLCLSDQVTDRYLLSASPANSSTAKYNRSVHT